MRTRPEEPCTLAAGGRRIAVDQHGYLLEPDDWDEAVAEELARMAKVELTALHWDVLHFMRAYLAGHGVAADARFVFRFLDSRGCPGKVSPGAACSSNCSLTAMWGKPAKSRACASRGPGAPVKRARKGLFRA